MKRIHKKYSYLTSVTLLLIFTISSLAAQEYDVLLKGGTVIDPKNNIGALSDVAISGTKIARVAANIPASSAKRVVNVTGLYVVPGLVDIHSHLFAGTDVGAHANGEYSVFPDGFTFRTGTTTIVDAGSSGWRNFKAFHDGVIALSHTRVLAWLNVVGLGLSGKELSQNVEDMNPDMAAKMAKDYPQTIVGFKTVQYKAPDWQNVDRALQAGIKADLPLLIDFGTFWPEQRSYQELVSSKLRPGDVSTHMYKNEGSAAHKVPLFDKDGKLLPYLAEARKRGIKFDLGHGLGNFNFPVVVPAIRQGWWPDAISTDLHAEDVNHAVKDLNNLMSKVMNSGIPFKDIVNLTTWSPAQVIRRPDLGHLTVGAGADVAVLNVVKGDFGFIDIRNLQMKGKEKIVCELTIRDGKVVWDLNGIAAREEYIPSSVPPVNFR